MGFYGEGEFDQNMDQLIKLLKKMMKSHPDQGQMNKLKSIFQENGVNLNVCFFNFFPITEDEMDELEEICEQYLSDPDKKPEDLKAELNAEDVDFLRRNGIKY